MKSTNVGTQLINTRYSLCIFPVASDSIYYNSHMIYFNIVPSMVLYMIIKSLFHSVDVKKQFYYDKRTKIINK